MELNKCKETCRNAFSVILGGAVNGCYLSNGDGGGRGWGGIYFPFRQEFVSSSVLFSRVPLES